MYKSMYETELFHHGILGMSWGKRNGPPYPLNGDARRLVRAEAKKRKAEEKLKEQKRKERIKKLEKKKMVLKGAHPKDIRKYAYLLTDKELEQAIKRSTALYREAPKSPAMETLYIVSDVMGKIGNIATSANSVVNLADRGRKVYRAYAGIEETKDGKQTPPKQ